MSGRQFWSDERLRRVGAALLIALLLACVFKYYGDIDRSSALKRGDFPGILSPAIILAQGQSERLYDRELHHEIQRRIWPSFGDEMYISVYPPFFAAALLPLADLDPLAARNVWTAINLICYLASLLLLRQHSSALREHFLFVAITLLLFAPVLFGVLGGQNSGISMLLFVGAVHLLAQKTNRADLAAGMLFGLWLFKPQFGVLAGVYLVLARRGTALVGYLLVAAIYWLVAAHFLGANWIALWLSATKEFAAINFTINDHQMASFAGALSSLSRASLFPAQAILPGSIMLSGLLLLLVWSGKLRSAWLLGPIAVLVSPQTLFYDLSIAFAACLPFATLENDRQVNSVLGFGIVAALFFALRDYCPFALPVVMGLAAFAFVSFHAMPANRA